MTTNPTPPLGIGDRYIRTKVTRDGAVTVEAFGFENEGCIAATQDLEQHIGGPSDERIMKPPEAPGAQSVRL